MKKTTQRPSTIVQLLQMTIHFHLTKWLIFCPSKIIRWHSMSKSPILEFLGIQNNFILPVKWFLSREYKLCQFSIFGLGVNWRIDELINLKMGSDDDSPGLNVLTLAWTLVRSIGQFRSSPRTVRTSVKINSDVDSLNSDYRRTLCLSVHS